MKDNSDSNVGGTREIRVEWTDVILFLFRYKWIILALTIIAAALPVILGIRSLTIPFQKPAYIQNNATCTVLLQDERTEELLNLTKSDEFRLILFRNAEVLKALQGIYWDSVNTEWSDKKMLTRDDFFNLLASKLIITNSEKKAVVITFMHRDAGLAQVFLTKYISELERYSIAKKQEKAQIEKRGVERYLDRIRNDYNRTKDPFIREALAGHIADQVVKKSKLSESAADFDPFDVLIAPAVYETKPVPQRPPLKGMKVILLTALAGFVISILMASIIEYIGYSRKNPSLWNKFRAIRAERESMGSTHKDA